jgi:hypothetical protein
MRLRRFINPALALLFAAGLSTVQAADTCQGGPSTGFLLTGEVETSKRFTPETLAEYQASRLTVSYYSGSSGLVTQTYLGVPLLDLINEAVVITNPDQKNDRLRKYLLAHATDCYQAVVALAEILPTFGGQPVMVAYATVDDAGIVTPLDEDEGAVRLIVPGDKAGGRFVSNLMSIGVFSPSNVQNIRVRLPR